MKVEFYQGNFTKILEDGLKKATKKGAKIVADDARARCPKKTGKLAATIRVKKSKFEDGGHLVYVGDREAYYGLMVELGTPGTWSRSRRAAKKAGLKRRTLKVERKPVGPKPYMRPALKANKQRILQEFQDIIGHDKK